MTESASAPHPRPAGADRGIMTRTGRIWLREDGIVQITVLPEAEQTRADAERGMAAVWEVDGRRSGPLYVDLRQMKAVDRDARTYCAGPGPASVLRAVALRVDSP